MKLLSLFTTFFIANAVDYRQKMMKADSSKTFDENQIFEQMGVGTLGIYQYPFELNQLMYDLDGQFPELVRKFSVGKTHEGRDIMGYLIGLDLTSKDATMAKPAIIIDGAHHPRELSTISMSVYTMLRLLYGYVKEDPDTMYLLNRSAIVIIPAVNVDGYQAIGADYLYNQEFTYVRKNTHAYDVQTATCAD